MILLSVYALQLKNQVLCYNVNSQCSCWLHNECVNIPAHVADKFPFICPLCIKSFLSLISSLKSEISHLKAHIIKLEKSCKSLSTSTQLSVPKPITGSSISDITVKSTATSSMSFSSMSSQPVPSNSHPSKCHPISPNPAHLSTSSVRSNPSLPSKFLNKPPHFLSQALPPHLLPIPRYHQYPSTHKMPLLPTPQPPQLPLQFSHFHPPLQFPVNSIPNHPRQILGQSHNLSYMALLPTQQNIYFIIYCNYY